MKGRLEISLKERAAIEKKLINAPKEIKEFIQVMLATKESKTCLNYTRILLDFYKFKPKPIKSYKTKDIVLYMEHIRYKRNENGDVVESASATRQLVWSALNQFFIYMVDSEVMGKNPMKAIARPKTEMHTPNVALTMEELNKVLDGVETYSEDGGNNTGWIERDRLILYLLMVTGMRRTALTEINMEDIDFEENVITVIDKRNKKQIYYIDDKLRNYLDKYLIKRDSFLDGRRPTDALFISNRAKRIVPESVTLLVRRYTKHALGVDVSPHKLRASFVTLYYEASGHDIVATCKAVGHASIETTNRYIKGKNDSRKKAMAFMSEGLN